MSRMQNEYGPRGFQSLGVAYNPMANLLVPDFVKQYGVNYPIGFAQWQAVHDYLGVPPTYRMTVPQLVYIDRQGMIRAQSPALGDEPFFQEKSIRSMIESLLKEPVAAGKTAPAANRKKTQ